VPTDEKIGQHEKFGGKQKIGGQKNLSMQAGRRKKARAWRLHACGKEEKARRWAACMQEEGMKTRGCSGMHARGHYF
jgi:hypothetical protein